ncbi:uncharacterized protein LOC142765310 [Rhipicephalus microplus]|uniref:uncharacterized protein LOC142765310 n=1 Tax=Rhipicephalus microplus TaxID=6941 RepID=UPI003F6BAD63
MPLHGIEEQIPKNIDSKKFTLGIILDFRKALDSGIFLAPEPTVAATEFVTSSASQFVDSLERESKCQAELHNLIVEPRAASDSPIKVLLASPSRPVRCSRSVHTWPGRRSSASISKVATFPRCAHLDETGLPALHDEYYLYPDWALQYPQWNLSGTELPTWVSRSNFTMDLNSLHDEITRKWISINTALYNRTLNLPTLEDQSAQGTLSGARF